MKLHFTKVVIGEVREVDFVKVKKNQRSCVEKKFGRRGNDGTCQLCIIPTVVMS